MAGFKFYLKDPQNTEKYLEDHSRISLKDQKETPLQLHVHYNSTRIKIYIDQKVKSGYWNQKEQKAITFPGSSELNSLLSKIKSDAQRVFINYKTEHGQFPPKAILKNLIEVEIGVKQAGPSLLNFFDYFEDFIKGRESDYCLEKGIKDATERAKLSFRNSAIPGYKRSLDLLREFGKIYHIDFNTINNSFKGKYIRFLQENKGFEKNTVIRHFKLLKTVMNTAASDGHHDNMVFRQFKFKSKESFFISLNETELGVLANMQLKPYHEKIRDLFLIGCWSGLRFSDFSRLNPDMIDYETERISIKTQKTEHSIVIPFLPELKVILMKYKDSRLPSYANQVMNRELKEIAKLLAEKLKESEYTLQPKDYSKLTTHTARRSFCTNMYRRGIPVEKIMPISGHKSEKQFKKYIRVSEEEWSDDFKRAAIKNSPNIHLKAV